MANGLLGYNLTNKKGANMTHEELKAITDRVYENVKKGTAAKGWLGLHEKAAKAYEKYGKTENAKAARKMATKVRGL